MTVPAEELAPLGPQSGGLGEARRGAGGISHQRAPLQVRKSQSIAGLHASTLGGVGEAGQAPLLVTADTATRGIAKRQRVGGLGDPSAGSLLQESGSTVVIGGSLPLFGHKDDILRGSLGFWGSGGGSHSLLTPNASVIAERQAVAGIGMPILGGGFIQAAGFGLVFLHAQTVLMAQPQSASGLRQLGGCAGIPFGGGCHVTDHTEPPFVAASQVVLGGSVPRVGGGFVVLKCLLGIGLGTDSLLIANAQSESALLISSVSTQGKETEGPLSVGGNTEAAAVSVSQTVGGVGAAHAERIAIPSQGKGGEGMDTRGRISRGQKITQSHSRLRKGEGDGSVQRFGSFHSRLDLMTPDILREDRAGHAVFGKAGGGLLPDPSLGQGQPLFLPCAGQQGRQPGTAKLTHGHADGAVSLGEGGGGQGHFQPCLFGTQPTGLIQEADGGTGIPSSADAVPIQKSQLIQRGGISLLRGRKQAFSRPLRILHDPQTPQITHTDMVVSSGISRQGSLGEQTDGGLGIPFGTPSRQVELTHTDAGVQDPFGGGLIDPMGGLHLQLGHALPPLVSLSQGVAGLGIPLMGGNGGGDGMAIDVLHTAIRREAGLQPCQMADEKTVDEQRHRMTVGGISLGCGNQGGASLRRSAKAFVQRVLRHADAKNRNASSESEADIRGYGLRLRGGRAGQGDEERGLGQGLRPMLGIGLLVDTDIAEAVAGQPAAKAVGLLPSGQGVGHTDVGGHGEVSFRRIESGARGTRFTPWR